MTISTPILNYCVLTVIHIAGLWQYCFVIVLVVAYCNLLIHGQHTAQMQHRSVHVFVVGVTKVAQITEAHT
jgi:hypothetical protein